MLDVLQPNGGVTVDVAALSTTSTYATLSNMELTLPQMDLPLARMLLAQAEELKLSAGVCTGWKHAIAVMEHAKAHGLNNTYCVQLKTAPLGGRLYARCAGIDEPVVCDATVTPPPWAGAMMSHKKFFKNSMYVFSGRFVDFDQTRSHPTILYILGERIKRLTNPDGTPKYPLVQTDGLKYYIQNREQVIADISRDYSAGVAPDERLDGNDVKMLFNITAYGGGWRTWMLGLLDTEDDPLKKPKHLKPGSQRPLAWTSYQSNIVSITQALYSENPDYATILRDAKEKELSQWKVRRDARVAQARADGSSAARSRIAAMYHSRQAEKFARLEADRETYYRNHLLSYILQTVETALTFCLYQILLERCWIHKSMFDWAHDGLTAWISSGVTGDVAPGEFMQGRMAELNAEVHRRTGMCEGGIGVEFTVKDFALPDEAKAVLARRRQMSIMEDTGEIGGVVEENPTDVMERRDLLPAENVALALRSVPLTESNRDKFKAHDHLMDRRVVPLLNRSVALQSKGAEYVIMKYSTEPIELTQQGANAKGTTKYAEFWSRSTANVTVTREVVANWKVRYQHMLPQKEGAPADAPVRYKIEVVNAFEAWREHYARNQYDDSYYAPWTYAQQPAGIYYIPNSNPANRWCAMPYDRVCAAFFRPTLRDITSAFWIIRHMFFISGEEWACFVSLLYFVAHIVQYPSELPGVMLFFVSLGGTGKDVLFNFLMNMLGSKHATTTTKMEHVFSDKNGLIEDLLLIILNESDGTNWKTGYDAQQKSMVTEKRRTLRKLYHEATTTVQCARLVRVLNPEEVEVALGKVRGNRRGYFFECSDRPRFHYSDYFAPLDAKSICERTLMTVFWLLQRIDIEHWEPQNIVYSRFHRQHMRQSDENILAIFMLLLLENYTDGFAKYYGIEGSAMSRRYPLREALCESSMKASVAAGGTVLEVKAQALFDAWCAYCEETKFMSRDKVPRMYNTNNAFGRQFADETDKKKKRKYEFPWVCKKRKHGGTYYVMNVEQGLNELRARLTGVEDEVPCNHHVDDDIRINWRKVPTYSGSEVDERDVTDPEVVKHVENLGRYIHNLEEMCQADPSGEEPLFYDPFTPSVQERLRGMMRPSRKREREEEDDEMNEGVV